MSRTARLFKLMDALRGHRRPVTAARLADDLGVSVRTVYRDVQTLTELGAPIAGESGIGYLLRSGFFLPPLMFGEDELEALVLGARWVQGQGDPTLAQAAEAALAKIATASPRTCATRLPILGCGRRGSARRPSSPPACAPYARLYAASTSWASPMWTRRAPPPTGWSGRLAWHFSKASGCSRPGASYATASGTFVQIGSSRSHLLR